MKPQNWKRYKAVIRPVQRFIESSAGPTPRPKHRQTLHAMGIHMLRWSLGLTRLDTARNGDIGNAMGVAPIADTRCATMTWSCFPQCAAETVWRKSGPIRMNPPTFGDQNALAGQPCEKLCDARTSQGRRTLSNERKWRRACSVADAVPAGITRRQWWMMMTELEIAYRPKQERLQSDFYVG